MSKYAADKMDEGTEVAAMPSRWFKFGKVGDVIKGYLVGKEQKPNEFKPGEMQTVYEIEAIAGDFDMGNGNSAKTVDVRIGSVKGEGASEVEL